MAGHQPVVLISACKAEKRTLRAGFKQLGRRLKKARCDVQKLDAAAGLAPELLSRAALLVFGCPTLPFSLEELDVLRQYVAGGGNLLVLSSEGGEDKAGTNLNYLLEEYGMSFASDCTIQSTFRKFPHPKQVLVEDGILSPDMAAFCAINTKRKQPSSSRYGNGSGRADENGKPQAQFAYPFGSTVLVQEPAMPILSTGTLAHPYNMAAGAAWQQEGTGRVVMVGSAHMFDDEWLGKEDNEALLDFLVGWLLKDPACTLSQKTLREPEIVDVRPVTHLETLAAQPRVCLQEHEELPRDITALFASSLFGLDLAHVPRVGALYRQLGEQRGALPIWKPQFEVPFPALQPAIFPPPFTELPPPPLELFDLDEEFATPLEKLNSVTKQYLEEPQNSQQLERYVRECAQLLGLRGAGTSAGTKELLAEALGAVVACKMPAADSF
ncbi:hypothetical protein N2152v2_005621 [Parachlorella kessleri]